MARIHHILLMAWLAFPLAVSAQGDDMAYVPHDMPERTADDTAIDLLRTHEPGIVDLVLPIGTHRVDLLSASGNVVRTMDMSVPPQLDLRSLRPGTWTLRAHTNSGARVRRFLVLGNSGTMWTDQGRARTRRH